MRRRLYTEAVAPLITGYFLASLGVGEVLFYPGLEVTWEPLRFGHLGRNKRANRSYRRRWRQYLAAILRGDTHDIDDTN